MGSGFLAYGNRLYKFGGVTISSSIYCKQARDYFDRMITPPSQALRIILNNSIKDLKAAGVWNKADIIYVPMIHTEQASTLNLIKAQHYAYKYNNPVFTAYRGWNCNYPWYDTLNFSFNPYTEGVKTLNQDCSFIVWGYCVENGNGWSNMYFKPTNGFSNYIYDIPTGVNFVINGRGAQPFTDTRVTGNFMFGYMQGGTNKYYSYDRDGNWTNSVYDAGEFRYDYAAWILNGAYGAVSGTINYIRGTFIGGYLSPTERTALHTIMTNLIASIYALG